MQSIKESSERYDDIAEKLKIFWENDGFLPGAEASADIPTDYMKLGIFLLASVTNMMEDLNLSTEEASDNGHFILAGSAIIAKAIDEAVKYEKVAV